MSNFLKIEILFRILCYSKTKFLSEKLITFSDQSKIRNKNSKIIRKYFFQMKIIICHYITTFVIVCI